MERRELLKQVGVAAGAAATGMTGIAAYDGLFEARPDVVENIRETPRENVPEYYTDEFERIVDAASAGADPGGQEPINEFLTEYARGDTLLMFQPGTYRLRPAVLSEITRFGIVGIGEERPTFEPSGTSCEPGNAHLIFDSVDEFLLEDVDFDFQQNGSGGSIQLFADGEVRMRNLQLLGHCPEQIATFRVDVLDGNAQGRIENLVARDEDGDSKLTGVYVGKKHAGTLTFSECDISGFSDNGLYASSPGLPGGADGNVEVVGGTFSDNNISNVRLGSTGSAARDVTIDIDQPPPLNGSVNARGIRLRERGGHVVDGCEITIGERVPESLGAIVVHPDVTSASISDTQIRVDAESVPAVNALQPRGTRTSDVTFDGLTVRGSADSNYAVTVTGRDETVLRNCTIDQNGYDRGGIWFRDADSCRITDSEITTTGTPIAVTDSSVTIEDTTIATPAGTRTIDRLEATDEAVRP